MGQSKVRSTDVGMRGACEFRQTGRGPRVQGWPSKWDKNRHPGSMQQGQGGERGMANGIKTRQAGKNRGYVSSHSWGMSIGMAQPHVARRRLPCRAGSAWEKTGGRREGRHVGIKQAGTVKMDIMGGERAPGGLVGGFLGEWRAIERSSQGARTQGSYPSCPCWRR